MRRRNMYIVLFVLLISFVVGCSWSYYLGTDRYLLSYAGAEFFHANENYTMTVTEHPTGSALCSIDLYDLPSNTGKVLFDDGTCSIEIMLVADDGYDGYNIYFSTHGYYSIDGGRLITSLPRDDVKYPVGSVEVVLGDDVYQHNKWIVAGELYSKQGDEYGFQLFPNDCYDHGVFLPADDIAAANGTVMVRLTNLYEVNWNPIEVE